jgi:hypothetical protein
VASGTSSAAAGTGAGGGSSVGWFDVGTATLVGEESAFQAGVGGPGGAGSTVGPTGAADGIGS